jgi:uncharacterized protein involved in response to NO
MKISEPAVGAPSGLPLLRLGFRPFYLGGAFFGALAIAFWLVALRGYPMAGRSEALSGMLWHVHEMMFGFVAAILAGFLLTAVRAWTGLDTPRGALLAWLWLLWAAGRVLVWSGPEPVAAVVDSAFLPIVALVLLRVLIAARNRRNLFLPVALGLFGVLNALFHWWSWRGRGDLALRDAYAALGLVVMFVAVIAGRVIPMFTANAMPGFAMKRWRLIEVLAGPIVLVTFLADAFKAAPLLIAACACAAAAIHGARMAGWRSWKVGARPILWILHVAYAWIPVGFAMLALAAFGAAPHTLAIHAFSVGAIGCAIIAMITRTALGHTGRPLIAGAVEIASYGLMIAAGLMRVFSPWLAGAATPVWIDGAGLCWFVALVLYLIKYVPYLTAPRIDGKGG